MSKRHLNSPKHKPPEAQGSSKCASERGGNAEGSSRHEQSFMDGFQDGFRRGRYLDGFQEGQFMGYRARLRPRYHDEIAYDKDYDDVNDIYIMMQCLSVTKNDHFLLGVSCNHLNPP